MNTFIISHNKDNNTIIECPSIASAHAAEQQLKAEGHNNIIIIYPDSSFTNTGSLAYQYAEDVVKRGMCSMEADPSMNTCVTHEEESSREENNLYEENDEYLASLSAAAFKSENEKAYDEYVTACKEAGANVRPFGYWNYAVHGTDGFTKSYAEWQEQENIKAYHQYCTECFYKCIAALPYNTWLKIEEIPSSRQDEYHQYTLEQEKKGEPSLYFDDWFKNILNGYRVSEAFVVR